MEPLCCSLLEKIHEQIDRAAHLTGMLRPEHLDWTPPIRNAWPAGVVAEHLVSCFAGFCAALMPLDPERLAHFELLRDFPITNFKQSIERFRNQIDEGFAVLCDADLARKLPSLFAPEGQTVLALLLGNLEHVINHKHQLFMYLKLLNCDAGTADLYRLPGLEG